MFNWLGRKQVDISKYFIGVREVASKTTQLCSFIKLTISEYEFCLLVKASKRVVDLSFVSCIISVDSECNFGEMRGCKITMLSLSESWKTQYWDLEEHKQWNFNILAGIGKCRNLRNALTKIDLCSIYSLNWKSDIESAIVERFKWLELDKHLVFNVLNSHNEIE